MKLSSFLSGLLGLSALSPHHLLANVDSLKDLKGRVNIEHARGLENKQLCQADEFLFGEIQQTLLRPFVESLNKKDLKLMGTFFSPRAGFDALLGSKVEAKNLGDDLTLKSWKSPGQGQNGFEALAEYVSSFQSIASADLDAFEYFIEKSWRNENHRYHKLRVKLELRVNGPGLSGQRQSDTFHVLADVSSRGGKWTMDSFRLVDAQRVTSKRAPAYREETKESGLGEVPVYLRREAMRRGGYSVTVTDFNNDSIPDLFFGTGSEAESLIGKKSEDGKIRFEKAPRSGLPEGTFVKTSVFADFDNDGDQDAILVRFVAGDKQDDELVFYRNNGKGAFTFEPLLRGASVDKIYPMPAAVGDYNHDGFLDVYVGYPGKQDFTTILAENDPSKNNSIPHGLFYSKKGKEFLNVTKNLIRAETGPASQLFPHSALGFDYDQNGTTDIIVVDDRNNLSPMYKNTGAGFEQVAQKIGIGNHGFGMSVAIGDYNNDGRIDIAQTNVESVPDTRYLMSCYNNWAVQNNERMPGLRLFRNEGNGTFTDVTKVAGIGWAGAATGGLTFLDYNNDGFDDIYVVNGLWSGNEKGNEVDSLWAMSLRSAGDTIKGAHNQPQSTIMRILMGFEGNIQSGQVAKGSHPSFSGFQRNKLFRNNGDGTFTDVAYVENVDEVNDGYAVVTMDIDRDGKQELLLRNADPGTSGNKFPSVQLYRNSLTTSNKSITLSFRGTDSSRDAIGTEVVANYGGKKLVRQLIANNGPQQAERTLHFGIGTARSADLMIRWPNGTKEIRKSVLPGNYVLTEPSNRKIGAR